MFLKWEPICCWSEISYFQAIWAIQNCKKYWTLGTRLLEILLGWQKILNPIWAKINLVSIQFIGVDTEYFHVKYG